MQNIVREEFGTLAILKAHDRLAQGYRDNEFDDLLENSVDNISNGSPQES